MNIYFCKSEKKIKHRVLSLWFFFLVYCYKMCFLSFSAISFFSRIFSLKSVNMFDLCEIGKKNYANILWLGGCFSSACLWLFLQNLKCLGICTCTSRSVYCNSLVILIAHMTNTHKSICQSVWINYIKMGAWK